MTLTRLSFNVEWNVESRS